MKPPQTAREAKAEIAALIESGDVAAARRLLGERARTATAMHEFPWIVAQFEKTAAAQPPAPLRMAVLSSYTIEPVRDALRAKALAAGVDVDVYFGPYNQFEQEILAPTSGLAAHDPQTIVFAWQLEDLSPRLARAPLSCTAEGLADEIEAVRARVTGLVDACADNFAGASLLLHTFADPEVPALGIIDSEHPRGQQRIVAALNDALASLAAEQSAVHLVDCRRAARAAGPDWFVPRHWYTARAPHGPAALSALADLYAGFARAVAGRTKKVLVVDLDNTLWGGVLGEDGADGIALGTEYPGSAFADFQREIKELAARGVVLAVNSKNNEDDVTELFASHPDMVLDWKDFAATRVNWQDKAANLRELADELSLGLDSFVFVDDNPVEIGLVAAELPEVATVLVPSEPAALPGAVSASGLFDGVVYSDEDRSRGQMYRAEAKRTRLERSATDLDGFLRSLQMRLVPSPVTGAEVARVAQLTQRTNQFNMTTRRYGEAEVAAMADDPSIAARCFSLEDRFGPSGIIAAVLAREVCEDGAKVWELDTFLMSCRVVGRMVETAILALIAGEATRAGAVALVGEVVPTKKNAPAREVYRNHGFAKVGDDEGPARWRLHLAEAKLRVPDWIEIVE